MGVFRGSHGEMGFSGSACHVLEVDKKIILFKIVSSLNRDIIM